jgi:hypothetical protein
MMEKQNNKGNDRNEKRTDSERFGIRSTPGLDPNDQFEKDPSRGPEGGLSAQGEGMRLKSDDEMRESMRNTTPKPRQDEGTMNGRESQRGMNQAGIDQRGRQGTANQHNG